MISVNEMIPNLMGLVQSTILREIGARFSEQVGDCAPTGELTYSVSSSRGFNIISDNRVFFLKMMFSKSGDKIKAKICDDYCFEDEQLFAIKEDHTPLSFLKEILDFFSAKFRKPVSPGCVQAFFGPGRFFWVSKRPQSDNICQHSDGHYYIAEGDSRFIKVFTGETESKWYPNDVRIDFVNFERCYYLNTCCVPVYCNALPFTEIAIHVPSWEAERRYQTVVVDGETRYIHLEIPGIAFFKSAIHSYSMRVERLVPPDKLFLFGETDLYSKRPKQEVPFLGWELEAASNTHKVASKNKVAEEFKSRMPYQVFCKNDGSISPDGFETVSVPATLDFWKESDLSDTLDAMRAKPYNMRSWKHPSCGVHVHVSRSALSVLDLQKLERFMHNPANRGFLEAVAGRGANNYQKYYDTIFSDRKKPQPTSSGNFVVDGAVYFGRQTTPLSTTQYVRLYEGRGPAYMFYQALNDTVSFTSVERIVSTTLWSEFYGEARSNGVNYPGSFKRIAIALSRISPYFRWYYQKFFTEFENELPPVTYSTASSSPSWKSTYVSTKDRGISFKREDNYHACQVVTGPVGKGAQRYDVLNTSNANTVEFRLFKGTMNPSSMFRYLEFVDAMVRFSANTSATNEGLHFEKFITWVMMDAFNISRYENLVSFFVESKFFKRENIRRRSLPTMIKGEGDFNVTPKPRAKIDAEPVVPLGTFNTSPGLVTGGMSVIPLGPSEEYDEDDPEEYDEPDDIEGCDCDDCLRARGEITF